MQSIAAAAANGASNDDDDGCGSMTTINYYRIEKTCICQIGRAHV